MNKLFGLLLLLITNNICGQSTQDDFPNNITNKRTNKHSHVKGTNIYVVFPQDFQYNKEYARYQKNNKFYIEAIEASLSFAQMKTNYTKERIELEKDTVHLIKSIKVNSFDAIYFENTNQFFPGRISIVLLFGDDSFTLMIEGSCNSYDKAEIKELKGILASILYDRTIETDPLEFANFRFDQSIANFKYVMTLPNFYIYSKNGKDDIQNPTVEAFSIGEAPKMTDEKAQSYANDLLGKAETSGISLVSKKIIETRINNYKAYILETKCKNRNKDGILYQVVLIGENSCVIFVGTAYNNFDDNLIKYKKTVESIKIK